MIEQKEKGFTLIEMLVVIAIMGLLLSVVVTNFGTSNKLRNLNAAKAILVSDLHRMQTFALTSQNVSTNCPAGSYGITFSNVAGANSSYSLYSAGNGKSGCPGSQVLSTTNLPKSVYIKTLNITSSTGAIVASTNLTTYFIVPYARIQQTYSGGATSAIKEYNAISVITLSTTDDTSTIDIAVNGIAGNISSQ